MLCKDGTLFLVDIALEDAERDGGFGHFNFTNYGGNGLIRWKFTSDGIRFRVSVLKEGVGAAPGSVVDKYASLPHDCNIDSVLSNTYFPAGYAPAPFTMSDPDLPSADTNVYPATGDDPRIGGDMLAPMPPCDEGEADCTFHFVIERCDGSYRFPLNYEFEVRPHGDTVSTTTTVTASTLTTTTSTTGTVTSTTTVTATTATGVTVTTVTATRPTTVTTEAATTQTPRPTELPLTCARRADLCGPMPGCDALVRGGSPEEWLSSCDSRCKEIRADLLGASEFNKNCRCHDKQRGCDVQAICCASAAAAASTSASVTDALVMSEGEEAKLEKQGAAAKKVLAGAACKAADGGGPTAKACQDARKTLEAVETVNATNTELASAATELERCRENFTEVPAAGSGVQDCSAQESRKALAAAALINARYELAALSDPAALTTTTTTATWGIPKADTSNDDGGGGSGGGSIAGILGAIIAVMAVVLVITVAYYKNKHRDDAEPGLGRAAAAPDHGGRTQTNPTFEIELPNGAVAVETAYAEPSPLQTVLYDTGRVTGAAQGRAAAADAEADGAYEEVHTYEEVAPDPAVLAMPNDPLPATPYTSLRGDAVQYGAASQSFGFAGAEEGDFDI